ncbi:hypothetical protein [Sciscionella marina]|nr:hypothetical protein [Sciscionella marina]
MPAPKRRNGRIDLLADNTGPAPMHGLWDIEPAERYAVGLMC